MTFTLNLPDQAINAIKSGVKKVECRVPKELNSKYHQMAEGDEIVITNEDTGETLSVLITFKHHYPDVRSLLIAEGVENVPSTGGTVEDGIKFYHSFPGYKENLPKFGIFAIGIKPIFQTSN